MRTQGEHIRTLRRRVDFLKAIERRNSYDLAELGALEWVLVNLPLQPSKPWIGLTDEERRGVRNSVGYNQFVTAGEYADHVQKATEFLLKEKNAL